MKSYVSMEQAQCPVCTKTFDTGAILINKQLKETLEEKTLTHRAFCKECQEKKDDGYIALVEIDPEKSPEGKKLQLGDAYRTGVIIYIKRAMFEKFFKIEVPFTGDMTFIDPDITKIFQGLAETGSWVGINKEKNQWLKHSKNK